MSDRTLNVLAAAMAAALAVINEAIDSGDLPTVTAGEVAAAQNTTEVVLDAAGLPWDERIHASTKSQTKENLWTKRKSLGEGVYEAVVAELRQKFPAPATTVVAPAPAAVEAPAVVATPTISVPNLSAPVVQPKTPYQKLVDFLALNTGAGKSLTSEWVNEQFTANGMSLAALAAPEQAATAEQFLEAFRGVLVSMNVAEVTG